MKAGTSRCSNATVSRAVHGLVHCAVLLKMEEVARNCTDIGPHLPVLAAHPDNTLYLF